jgi:phage-related protein
MRELVFLGDSLEALGKFPDEVKQDIGYALHFAQEGKTHHKAKPFKGYSRTGNRGSIQERHLLSYLCP